jgi:ABC-type Fe3+-hydroxamate transport system substrate-binding protein
VKVASNKTWRISVLTAGLIFLGGAGDASPSPRSCQTFVTLSPALSIVSQDLLQKDGITSRLRGVAAYSPLASDLKIPEVASAGRIDVERILSLAPDCALIAPGVLPAEVVERFVRTSSKSAHPIRIITVQMDSLIQIAEGYVAIGRELGAEQRGVELAETFRAKLRSLHGRLTGVRAFIQVDDQPLVAVGGARTFLSEAFEHLGVRNVLAATREAYPRVSVESVIAASPDRIWVLGEPSNSRRYEVMAASWRTRFPSLKVVRNGGVRVVLSRELTLPALSLLSGMERLVRDEGR